MSKIKVGVFGAARGMTMIGQLQNNPHAELVAVCDKFKPALDACRSSAEAAGKKLALFENFEDFFGCDMDAVVLANYADEHAPFAIRLLDSGRHVMSEVLTCASLDEGLRLAEAVERSGKIYYYAENYCYFNTTAEMRLRYLRGDVGELVHAEGEYIHDCSSVWPQITYGQRDHWRNNCASTFYCTHSLGPILFATGLRPVSVVGFESPNRPFMRNLGVSAGTHGIEMVQLENGATVKSIHGSLKREPSSINYEMYCTRGSMETDRHVDGRLHVYTESERNCVGSSENYEPAVKEEGAAGCGHGGSDYFTTNYFVRAIAGDPYATSQLIDIYTALDMCVPGILAFKSILSDNKPFAVPDYRDRIAREICRGDTFNTHISEHIDKYGTIPDEVYDYVRDLWKTGKNS